MILRLRTNSGSAIKIGPETLRQQRPALTITRRNRTMAARSVIPIPTLRQLLSYDPETGALTWRPRTREMCKTYRSFRIWQATCANQPALTNCSQGYFRGTILGRPFKAHRVAWALHYGEWPQGDIDHINGDPTDNRIINLRTVDHRTNMRNVKLRADSTSGVPGVSWFKRHQKWMASIAGRYIGYFATLEEATAARKAAERENGFHPNHGRAQ